MESLPAKAGRYDEAISDCHAQLYCARNDETLTKYARKNKPRKYTFP